MNERGIGRAGGPWQWILLWGVNSVAIIISASVFPGVILDRRYIAVLAALVLSVATYVLEPLLYYLTLPITVATLGMFTVVLNGIILIIVEKLVPGFHFTGRLSGFGWAIITSGVIGMIRVVIFRLFRRGARAGKK